MVVFLSEINLCWDFSFTVYVIVTFFILLSPVSTYMPNIMYVYHKYTVCTLYLDSWTDLLTNTRVLKRTRTFQERFKLTTNLKLCSRKPVHVPYNFTPNTYRVIISQGKKKKVSNNLTTLA